MDVADEGAHASLQECLHALQTQAERVEMIRADREFVRRPDREPSKRRKGSITLH